MGNMHAYSCMFFGDIFYHLQICVVIIIFVNYHILVFGNSKKPKYGKMTHKNGPHIQNHFLKKKIMELFKIKLKEVYRTIPTFLAIERTIKLKESFFVFSYKNNLRNIK